VFEAELQEARKIAANSIDVIVFFIVIALRVWQIEGRKR
jgi:hypothetical protein